MRARFIVVLSTLLLMGAGSVPGAAQEKNPRLKALEQARYTLVEGVLRAVRALPGTVIKAEAEVEKKKGGGYKVVYQVFLMKEGKVFLVEVNGNTGKVEEKRELKRRREKGREEEERERGEREEKGEEEEEERGEKEEKGEEEEERGERVERGTLKEVGYSTSFENARPGGIPKGWIPAETNSAGTPGTWKVVRMKGPRGGEKVMALTRTVNRGHTFNLLLTKRVFPADLTLSVMIKAGTGDEDQGGGLVWRALDADNYYITRWNPLEDNFRLYKVVRGRRSMLTGVRLKVNPRKWHRITVKTKGRRITVFFDGKKYLQAEDSTFTRPGRVGLWTKADAASYFDDFQVSW
ncbi:MAG TPA: hypothetical protein ENJ97_07855 [Planctomycetes bacterium]|nr:hypothetical protein [Planctomycetota bacterium]